MEEKNITCDNMVKDCNFTGIHWDKEATEAVNNVALALLNLTYLFNNQNITVETMFRMPTSSINPFKQKEK